MTHRPDRALERLLDALEAELTAAPDDEIRQAAAEARHKVSYAAWDVRGVIRRAEAAASPAAPAAPVPRPWLPPPRWH
ncbi:hypothetical protein [Inquilinus limosus]|uniref:hypothetical protein n=1 Tax=Inquilinus limosus TaxID=171674 RepID=UPI00042022DC|nr:hypothetical protein [Inquilinus limosus]